MVGGSTLFLCHTLSAHCDDVTIRGLSDTGSTPCQYSPGAVPRAVAAGSEDKVPVAELARLNPLQGNGAAALVAEVDDQALLVL